jgi:hypothetical protein
MSIDGSLILNIALGIILAFAAVGLGLGYFAAIWGKNSELGALIAVPLATLLGVVGAFGCYRRNRQRARQKQ